jgi:hypothetical protein
MIDSASLAIHKLLWAGIMGAQIRQRGDWIDIIFEQTWNGAKIFKILPIFQMKPEYCEMAKKQIKADMGMLVKIS